MSLVPEAIRSKGVSPNPRMLRRLMLAGAAALMLSACQDSGGLDSGRAWKPIPREMIALMQEKGTHKHAPILIRAFKKEAELEVWKMRADGTYAHLKTYPVCRWSGQLGPKRREGDRQVPEGFYSVTPGLMNPNSAYFLSFNIGYPNAFDRAHGFTGGLIMVHGACSSAGCFAMTDEQMGEIYAIAREAFAGGQRSIQVQSLPFRMTPENLARYRLDPNMPFWRQIKDGADIFEVTKREPQVAFCGRRYVFNGSTSPGAPQLDPNVQCPPVQQDPELTSLLAKHRAAEEAKVAALVNKGVRPVRLKFADGGQHPTFANVQMVSRPEALAAPPVEIALDDSGTPAVVRVASARTQPTATSQERPVEVAGATPAAPQDAAPAGASAFAQGDAQAPFYRRWLGALGGLGGLGAAQAAAPAPAPAAAPATQRGATRPNQAAPRAGAPRRENQRTSELPAMIRGGQPALPAHFMAYAPTER